ncbi:DeoR/GlpR family DNA-binding transcription regulator [Arcobacter sp. F2176]|jgi:DeoR family glycerol-3-phosphate regulon repressor|uniref:DeoR/GlpR family DNA-binding transcription regulator n=1 Tax=Arcobacter sp. F2176 TaxID=2044511 RepID=UPI00100B4BEA|nr:DeoR/GlpR family DNA-binding transcription regulator [Arcobacter sp. F2176]RXJ82030.1 DeoR family transcriptional regulator [Arcobacter sp. F2176]
MKPKERQAYILEKVRQEKSATVEKLSKIFSVSVQSIRKDINFLCEEGLLRRIYGGVEMALQKDNISYDSRKIIHYDEKKIIARLIAKQIPNNSSLFFSIGTTPEIIAKELINHKNLKIFTNNLNVALVCCENSSFEVTLHGGLLRNKHRDIVGNDIEKFFSSYSVDFGIYGVGAIEENGSLLDFTQEECQAREAISKSSKKVFLVADYSKFTRNAYIRSGNISNVDSIFCDKKPPENICKLLEKNGVEINYENE